MPELKEILRSINIEKNKDLIDEFNESDYNPFVINRILSSFPDTLFSANDLNQRPHVPKLMQYKYLLYEVVKKNRYSPWLKKMKNEEVTLLEEYFKISEKDAKELLPLLSKNDIEQITKELNKGG